MNKLQIILPMAGLGTRVKEISNEIPKPLIEINKIPLYQYALSFFHRYATEKNTSLHIIPIIRADHQNYFENKLPENLKKNIIILPHETRGALETTSFSFPFLDLEFPVIILDSDITFTCEELLNFNFENYDGGIITFNSNNPQYSYAKNENDYAIDIKEKEVISDEAICGAYIISHPLDLIKISQEILQNPEPYYHNNELYISSLFKVMLLKKMKIKILKADSFSGLGTTEEIQKFKQNNNDN